MVIDNFVLDFILDYFLNKVVFEYLLEGESGSPATLGSNLLIELVGLLCCGFRRDVELEGGKVYFRDMVDYFSLFIEQHVFYVPLAIFILVKINDQMINEFLQDLVASLLRRYTIEFNDFEYLEGLFIALKAIDGIDELLFSRKSFENRFQLYLKGVNVKFIIVHDLPDVLLDCMHEVSSELSSQLMPDQFFIDILKFHTNGLFLDIFESLHLVNYDDIDKRGVEGVESWIEGQFSLQHLLSSSHRQVRDLLDKVSVHAFFIFLDEDVILLSF